MDLSSLENHRKNGYSIRESEPHEDGTYSETIEADGTEISDGVWGCVAYSAITSLQEADMAMAFEYYLDTDYEFNTDFQKKMAEYLSQEYMDYINDQNLSVSEAAVDIDLNEDGDKEDVADLTIEYDAEKYADTNGYGGTYLTFYLKEFEKSLEWYLENIRGFYQALFSNPQQYQALIGGYLPLIAIWGAAALVCCLAMEQWLFLSFDRDRNML